MTTIPQDIADQLGELTASQQGTAQRLLQAVGADRTRELLAQAITQLAATRSDPAAPANAPKTVRGMLFHLLEGDALDGPTRATVFDRPYRDPALAQQITALADRLGETEQAPRTKIRQLVQALGIDAVEAVAAEAEQLEAGEGLLVPDGSRRRTLGGVFFHLMRQALTAEQRQQFFPNSAKKPQLAGEAPPQPVSPVLPTLPAFVWAARRALYQELQQQTGDGKMKVTLIGRPGRVVEKQDVVIMAMTMTKQPAMPKGVPAPLPTTASVYIARKQWAKVAVAIQNPEDILIVEGIAFYDPEMEGIVVSANTVTTKLLQQAKKQPAPAPEGA